MIAPKGLNNPAQGNALGNYAHALFEALTGRNSTILWLTERIALSGLTYR